MQKDEFRCLPSITHKNELKMIVDCDVDIRTAKALEETIGGNIWDFGLGKDFFGYI